MCFHDLVKSFLYICNFWAISTNFCGQFFQSIFVTTFVCGTISVTFWAQFQKNLVDYVVVIFENHSFRIVRKFFIQLSGNLQSVKSRAPILRVTSSNKLLCLCYASFEARRWLVNALVTWHASYKITTLIMQSSCIVISTLQNYKICHKI